MGKSVVLLTLLYVGYAAAGSASWSEDISVHNKHYSQHESSVNAARRAAAERLQQQQAASLVAASAPGPCDTLCYTGYATDASDVETIGQGIVGFTSTGTAGGAVSGASQKYSSSSSRVHESTVQNVHTAVPVPVPVYPATSTGSRSSFSSSSSSRHHAASQVAQPIVGQQLYASQGLDHGRTHSNVVAAGGVREGTYIQPVVYPVIAPITHTSQSTYGRSSTVGNQRPGTETVYVQVPVVDSAAVSNSNFNTRSSYVASSDQQQQQLVQQPSHYSNAATTGYANRNEYSSQQDQQYRRYPAKGTTYVLYSKPLAPVGTYYAPSRSHVEEGVATTYDASGRVVNLAGAQRTLTERTDEQRTQRVQSVHDNVGRVLPDTGAPLGDTYADEVDSYGSVDRSDQHSLRIASGAPSTSQRTEHQQQQHQQQHQYVRTGSYVPTAPVQHTAGAASSSQSRYSSSAHATESQRRQTYQPAVHLDTPLVTHGTAGAGSSVATSEYESTLEQRRQSSGGYVPIVAQPVASGVSSSSNRYQSAHEQRSNTLAAGATSGNPGGYYNGGVGAAGYGTQYAAKTSSAHSSSSSSNRYSKAGSPSLQYYPITNDEMGRRFGGVGGSATGLGANADLEGIMSETELLAREQAQNVHNGAVTGSGTIDLESHRDDDGLSRLPGGFQKTKSWSSSSKWASEQRYGSDGKPKTFSMLSTAESEKHNINGKTTGYKAATTTLEDDGKVSTYSLHTA
ncbi:cell wall protein AWA1-like isoform X2 [Anopheles albimanus]|uniref:cell wall protein AWA1-like isoform X2 n=1 Tax=Anopheles albimanus TaxID=7167 RepID=UPI0016415E02|nr:cell wall protein AWA1-like isoform X2 [Anopheles albimanus]